MEQRAGSWFVRIFGPVVIHFLILNMVQMTGLHADAAFLTTVAAAVSLPVFAFMMKRDGRSWSGGGGMSFLQGVKVAGLGLACNVGLTVLLNAVNAFFSFSNDTQEALFGSNLAVQVAGIGILVPIMEEVLFRGLVYQRLRDYNKKWPSVLIAAAIFAVYHGNALQMLFAFPMAVIIILIYRRWKTLTAPVLFHVAVNLSSILVTAVL